MTREGVVPGRPGIVLPDLESEERPFHFLSGRLCLALATTVGERWRRNFERLVEPSDLDRWIDGAKLAVKGGAPATELDLSLARRLRDAVHVLACEAQDAAHDRPRSYDAAALATVAESAARPDLVPTLGPDGSRSWTAPVGQSVAAALSTVARDAIDLFGSSGAGNVRHCDAPDCSLVYLDVSRGRRRRWCTMAGCGNRAKQRALRERAAGR